MRCLVVSRTTGSEEAVGVPSGGNAVAEMQIELRRGLNYGMSFETDRFVLITFSCSFESRENRIVYKADQPEKPKHPRSEGF